MDTAGRIIPELLPDERLDDVNESLRLIQKKQGLTFGTDAYLLAAFVRSQPRAHAVDLGSGTGIIPLLLLAREKVSRVTAIEIQESFVNLIDRNAMLNGFSDRLSAISSDVREICASQLGGEVDLVVSNPPYMKCDTGKRNEHDEKYIARHEVFGNVKDFCQAAKRLLRWGGRFVSVWRPDRLTDLLYALHEATLEPKRMTFVHADAEAEPCMVLTEAVKGGAPSLHVSRPLLLYRPRKDGEKNRVLTDAAQQIYDTCNFSFF
ncbi:MAG: methyltransferase [Clostridia bacterium]|nr:methyltransferase [Clostridia bacterium]